MFKKILFLFREREKERERNINVWLPLVHPLLGTWPETQVHALTRNQTSDPLILGRALNALSHTSQGTFPPFKQHLRPNIPPHAHRLGERWESGPGLRLSKCDCLIPVHTGPYITARQTFWRPPSLSTKREMQSLAPAAHLPLQMRPVDNPPGLMGLGKGPPLQARIPPPFAARVLTHFAWPGACGRLTFYEQLGGQIWQLHLPALRLAAGPTVGRFLGGGGAVLGVPAPRPQDFRVRQGTGQAPGQPEMGESVDPARVRGVFLSPQAGPVVIHLPTIHR